MIFCNTCTSLHSEKVLTITDKNYLHLSNSIKLSWLVCNIYCVFTGVEITEETTKDLEDIIRQRILDGAYDDVERKVKPKEDAYEFKKRVTLDQEKSKLSLAEIYEQEYIKQVQVCIILLWIL